MYGVDPDYGVFHNSMSKGKGCRYWSWKFRAINRMQRLISKEGNHDLIMIGGYVATSRSLRHDCICSTSEQQLIVAL